MTNRTELLAAMQAKLEQAGIGFESVKVFGVIRCNVHITCVSRDTAGKWAALLGQMFTGARVSLVPTVWEAAENKGTCLNPTIRKGFLVAVAA